MTLPSHARIVVIGGGIIGCSTAYHLARDHKAEVVLLEQGRLTSGSTWHAAGLVGQLRSSASITRVLKYSVDLYKGLAAETGLETGWKMTGCLRLATNQDRWTEYKRLATTARSFGMEMHLISPDEVKRMWPLMEVGDLVGASWLPTDGQASPSDITQSLAKGARMHGAKIFEGVRVTGFAMAGDRIAGVNAAGEAFLNASAKALIADWPSPIVWSGFEIGKTLTYPHESIEQDYGYVPHHPLSEAYIANRADQYAGEGWAAWFEASERELTGQDGFVVDYIARDDGATCSPCRFAMQDGPYLPGTGPYPGQVCLGAGNCRCERRPRFAPEEWARLMFG